MSNLEGLYIMGNHGTVFTKLFSHKGLTEIDLSWPNSLKHVIINKNNYLTKVRISRLETNNLIISRLHAGSTPGDLESFSIFNSGAPGHGEGRGHANLSLIELTDEARIYHNLSIGRSPLLERINSKIPNHHITNQMTINTVATGGLLTKADEKHLRYITIPSVNKLQIRKESLWAHIETKTLLENPFFVLPDGWTVTKFNPQTGARVIQRIIKGATINTTCYTIYNNPSVFITLTGKEYKVDLLTPADNEDCLGNLNILNKVNENNIDISDLISDICTQLDNIGTVTDILKKEA